MPGDGNPDATILLLGEALGEQEEAAAQPFQGRAGWMLEKCLVEAGLYRNEVWITNSVRCRPKTARGQNRKPTSKEIDFCRGWLLDEVATLPHLKVIVAMGAVALQSVLGPQAPPGGVLEQQGRVFPVPWNPALSVVASIHPAFALRQPREAANLVLDFQRAQHIVAQGRSATPREPQYTEITDLAQLPAMEADLAQSDTIAFDWEADGVHLTRSRGFCVSFSGRDHFAWVVRLYGPDRMPIWSRPQLAAIKASLGRIFRSPVPKIGFHVAYDLNITESTLGIPMEEIPVGGDPMIGSHLVDNHLGTRAHALKRLADVRTDYGRYDDPLDEWLIQNGYASKGKADHGYLYKAPGDIVVKYNACDAIVTRLINHQILKQIIDQGQAQVYYTERMPTALTYARIDRSGVRVDLERAPVLDQGITQTLKSLNAMIAEIATHPVNPNSNLQVRTLLFDELGLADPSLTPRVTGTGESSTKEEVLKDLADLHPVPELILHYRALQKVQQFINTSTGVAGAVDPDGYARTSTFVQGTETFRLVTRKPFAIHTLPRPLSLWNCPEHGSYLFSDRTDETRPGCECPVKAPGQPGAEPMTLSVRSLLIPDPGYHLASADYKQQEYALAAIISGQRDWEEAICDRGEDAHDFAMKLLGAPPKESFCDARGKYRDYASEIAYKNLRARYKSLNFMMLYLGGAKKLARMLGISVEDAQDLITQYYARLPYIDQWQRTIKYRLRETGRVDGVFGTYRKLPGIYSPDAMDQFEAERAACNFPFQNGGAHVTLRAVVALHRAWSAPGRGRAAFPARVLFSVHDEIVAQIREDLWEEGARTMHQIMTQRHPELVGACGVPRGIRADVQRTTEWGGPALQHYESPSESPVMWAPKAILTV